MGPLESLYGFGHTWLLCFLFCGMIAAFLLLGRGGGPGTAGVGPGSLSPPSLPACLCGPFPWCVLPPAEGGR